MSGSAPYWIDPQDTSYRFPDVSKAMLDPDGLLAVGGDLCPERLTSAYLSGIFPWYNEDQPILWWSPDPRAVIFPDQLKISRSLSKTLKKNLFKVTMDTAFDQVIRACSQSRVSSPGTWITDEMLDAYMAMFHLGHAHSIECWQDDQLVGGLYGLTFGQVFFGESMFSSKRDASKIALCHFVQQLQQWDYKLIDCQIQSEHMQSLGAISIPRTEFVQHLANWGHLPEHSPPWAFDL